MSSNSEKQFEKLVQLFNNTKQDFDSGKDDLLQIGKVGELAIAVVIAAQRKEQCRWGPDRGNRIFDVYVRGTNKTRPVRRDLFINNVNVFRKGWNNLVRKAKRGCKKLQVPDISSLLYSCAQGFACAYDLHKPTSRKTPGTFFEILIGSLVGQITGRPRGKQVDLPGEPYKVPTDILIEFGKGKKRSGLVLPTKITTRERVVQPWAHQRILDSVFGIGKFRSAFICVSELQRDKDQGVNEICTPHQVGMFQAHLARIEGMYYLDPPFAYLNAEFADPSSKHHLPVKDIKTFFDEDLTRLVDEMDGAS